MIRFLVVLFLVTPPLLGEAGCKSRKELTSELFPRTDPKLVGLVYKMLQVVDLLFTQHGIVYWIDGGTALGAVRHQGMIPWDDDADLVFLMKDEERIFALAEEFAKYGLYLTKEAIFRLYPSREIRYPFIDIAGYSLYPDNTLRFDSKPLSDVFPRFYWLPEEVACLERVKFGPIELNAPQDMMRYLFTGYGEDCMSMATFQTLHGPARRKVVIKKKVKITDFSPAEYLNFVHF
jgi:lipopolysaccharide cholinephosphotransferase